MVSLASFKPPQCNEISLNVPGDKKERAKSQNDLDSPLYFSKLAGGGVHLQNSSGKFSLIQNSTPDEG